MAQSIQRPDTYSLPPYPRNKRRQAQSTLQGRRTPSRGSDTASDAATAAEATNAAAAVPHAAASLQPTAVPPADAAFSERMIVEGQDNSAEGDSDGEGDADGDDDGFLTESELEDMASAEGRPGRSRADGVADESTEPQIFEIDEPYGGLELDLESGLSSQQRAARALRALSCFRPTGLFDTRMQVAQVLVVYSTCCIWNELFYVNMKHANPYVLKPEQAIDAAFIPIGC